jgi:periplasmic copper chaperone A
MTIDLKRAAGTALLGLILSTTAHAHGSSAGDVSIGHPYATPSVPGASNGAAYIANLENTGKQTDRLLRVSTPVAERSEMHTMTIDAGGVMRMREIAEIQLAPGAAIKMRPGEGAHFMLIGLKQPLNEGESFPMTMEFEHGGKSTVQVVVQAPKAPADDMAEHNR